MRVGGGETGVPLLTLMPNSNVVSLSHHKEYGRDKPDDRTATCLSQLNQGKVLKLELWRHKIPLNDPVVQADGIY